MRRQVELSLWALACCAASFAIFQARTARAPEEPALVSLAGAPRAPQPYAPEALFAAATTTAGTNPFRLDRRPSEARYQPDLEGAPPPAPPPPPPPRPQLALAGTVGGPPWVALIEGIPGREGSVLVRQGDSLAEFRIRLVARDSVIIEGADTTWILKIKRAWQ